MKKILIMNKKIVLSLLCFSLTTCRAIVNNELISKISGNKPTLVAVGTASLLSGYVAFKMLKQQYRKWMVYREYKSIEKEAQALYFDILSCHTTSSVALVRFKKLVKRTSTFYEENKVLIDRTLNQKQKELVKTLYIKVNDGVKFGLITNCLNQFLRLLVNNPDC